MCRNKLVFIEPNLVIHGRRSKFEMSLKGKDVVLCASSLWGLVEMLMFLRTHRGSIESFFSSLSDYSEQSFVLKLKDTTVMRFDTQSGRKQLFGVNFARL